MLAFAKTDIGLVRKTNEDSYVSLPPNLFVVADGMGGHEAGEIASSLAVAAISEYVGKFKDTEASDRILEQAICQANDIIYQMAQCKSECSGMGTTVTAVIIQDSVVFWGHVGDSRLYRLRGNTFIQITKDHSLVGELLENGTITPDEAQVHPHRNILTRAVGTSASLQVDTGLFAWEPNDQLFLCTDGLTSMVTDEMIANIIINGNGSVSDTIDSLIDAAIAAGGLDNITAILIRPEG